MVKANGKRCCNRAVATVIRAARRLEESDNLSEYVTGAAIEAIREWYYRNTGRVLSEEDSLSAFVLLFHCETTEIFSGFEEPEVLNTRQWRERLAALFPAA